MKTLTNLKYLALVAVFVMSSYIYFNSQSPVPEELSATSTEPEQGQGLSTASVAEPVSFSVGADDGANAQRERESLTEQRQTLIASLKEQVLAIENAQYEEMRKTPQQRWQEQEDAFSAQDSAQFAYDFMYSDFVIKLGLNPQDQRAVKEAMIAITAYNSELMKMGENGELTMEKVTEGLRGFEELDTPLGLLTSEEVEAFNKHLLEFSEQMLAEVMQEMDERAQYGHTPLMDSASYEAVSAVEAWIAEGVDVNAVYSVNGTTALMGAASYGNTDNVQALIDAGQM